MNEAEEFLNIVANEYSDDEKSIYFRVRQEWSCEDESKFWKYKVHPEDLNIEQSFNEDGSIEEEPQEKNFSFSFSIRFPNSDLKEVSRKVKQALQNKNNVNLLTVN